MKCIKRKICYAILSVLSMISLVSCFRITTEELEMKEAASIQEYMEDHASFNFVLKESGLYYCEIETGTGPLPAPHDTAYIFYSLKSLADILIETNSGTDDTLIVPVGEDYLITGLDEGITYMKEGGKALFLIPSRLAYGAYGNYYGIPGYTPLLFDVRLVRVKQGPGK